MRLSQFVVILSLTRKTNKGRGAGEQMVENENLNQKQKAESKSKKNGEKTMFGLPSLKNCEIPCPIHYFFRLPSQAKQYLYPFDPPHHQTPPFTISPEPNNPYDRKLQ